MVLKLNILIWQSTFNDIQWFLLRYLTELPWAALVISELCPALCWSCHSEFSRGQTVTYANDLPMIFQSEYDMWSTVNIANPTALDRTSQNKKMLKAFENQLAATSPSSSTSLLTSFDHGSGGKYGICQHCVEDGTIRRVDLRLQMPWPKKLPPRLLGFPTGDDHVRTHIDHELMTVICSIPTHEHLSMCFRLDTSD